MPFVEGAPYRDSDSEAPLGAAEFGPRREPWVPSEAPLPLPPPPPGGGGGRKGGGGRSPQGFRPGPQSSAPIGAGATYITNHRDRTLANALSAAWVQPGRSKGFNTESTEVTEEISWFFSVNSVLSVLIRVSFFARREEKQILRFSQDDMSF